LPLMAKLESGESVRARPARQLFPSTFKETKIHIASASEPSPGFVLDYITVSGNGSYTFQTFVVGGTNTSAEITFSMAW
jgi:hypothetical protein